MKQFLTLLLLMVGMMAAARPGDGMMSFTNLSDDQIIVEVDGKQYTDCETNIVIRDLEPGFHTVRVYSETAMAAGKRPILYTKRMQLKARYMVDIVINRFNRVFVDEEMITGRWGNDRRPQTGRTAMNEQSFLNFKQTLSKEGFDNSKLAIAKQVIDQNYFMAEQAKQIAQVFAFSDNRLEIAKYMYGRTIDKENYFIIYNILDFSRNKEALAAYIKNYK